MKTSTSITIRFLLGHYLLLLYLFVFYVFFFLFGITIMIRKEREMIKQS